MTASHKGFFKLRTPRDLLEKVRRDFDRLTANSIDQDAAFDFFVTARHVPDWIDANGGGAASDLFNRHVELRVCRHIADGAKHYEATHHHHEQVQRTDATAGGFQWNAFQSDDFPLFQRRRRQLMITLDPTDNATLLLGTRIEVVEMAKLVLGVLDRVVP